MLPEDDWRRQLHSGDEITWNDPDEGTCSRSGTILEIEYLDEDVAKITFTDGEYLEVLLEELS
jgi:hypothetical protein